MAVGTPGDVSVANFLVLAFLLSVAAYLSVFILRAKTASIRANNPRERNHYSPLAPSSSLQLQGFSVRSPCMAIFHCRILPIVMQSVRVLEDLKSNTVVFSFGMPFLLGRPNFPLRIGVVLQSNAIR